MTDEQPAQIRRYFDEMTPMILRTLGHTYQGALLADHTADVSRRTNILQADRARIRPGMRVLDAGCGAGGSAVDIAEHVGDVVIDAINVSPVQAAAARQHAADHGLAGRVRIHVGDFHRMPFASASFDVVYYFESACYTRDHAGLFREAFRVLRPGGTLYVKDLFARPELTAVEAEALAEINRSWLTNIGPLGDTMAGIRTAGFDRVTQHVVTDYNSDPFKIAMAKFQDGEPLLTESGDLQLTEFGRAHRTPLWLKGVSPAFVVEIWATRPEGRS